MKKSSTLTKVAVALFLGATAATANAQYPQAQDIVLGQAYSSFTWVSSDGGYPGTCLKFTAPTNGKLSIIQTTYDSHLYDEQWTRQSTWDNVYNSGSSNWYAYVHQIAPDKGYSSTDVSPYTLEYTLSAGQTVYYYARIDSSDPVTIQNTIWEAAAEVNYQIAEIGKPFNAFSEIWQYTPTVTGVMTVYQSAAGFTAGSDFSFVYTNPALNTMSQVLPNNTAISENMTWKFNVTAGQTYYFSQKSNSNLTFTITEVVEQTTPLVTLIGAQPAPGEGGLDDYSYVGGISLNLAPSTGVGIGSATFKYQSATDGSWVSKDLSVQANGGGNWSIIGVRDYYIQAMQGAAKPASMCVVVLEGLTVNGKTALADNELDPTYVNCNGSTMEIQYYIPDEYGFQLSKADWPDVIYKTWPEAGQSNGVATLIFNNNIKVINEVSMVYGHHVWGGSSGETVYPTFNIPYTIDGNTLTLDFTAAKEDPETIPTTTTDPSEVTVFINGIQNEYGILWGDDGLNTLTEYIQFNAGTAPAPAPTMDQAIVLSPVDGNTYALASEFSGFKVSFWDAEEGGISFVDSSNTSLDLYVGGNVVGEVTAAIDGMNMTVELGDYAGKNAEYMIWIPQGFVQNSLGEVNPGQGVSCKVLETNAQYTLSPDSGAELLDNEIKITYENSTLLVNESCPTPITWAYNNYMGQVSVAGDSFVIPLDLSVMELGEYTLKIPATYFVINASSLNPEIVATYSITTNGMTADFIDNNDVYTVYNMNGVKLLETADKSKLNTLGKGVYVINGKKVIVK